MIYSLDYFPASRASYGKTFHGARIATAIGLAPLRASCPHFNAWMGKLEGLE